MKARLTAAICIAALVFVFPVLAQTPRATIYITVKNAKGETRKGLDISLADKKNPTTATRAFTDDKGKAEFYIPRSVTYIIKIEGKAAGEVMVPATGSSTVIKNITTEFAPATAAMDTIKFMPGDVIKASETEGVAMVDVYSHSDKPVPGVKITLVCKKLNKAFVAWSDEKGKARMRVPLNNDYKLYTDDIEFGNTFNMPDAPYITKGLRIQYIPTKISETASGDTIRQNQNDITEATADRVFIYFDITDPQGNLLANEPVYLNMVNGTKVYTAQTSSAGRAKFLIPEGSSYTVNFKYERDVDLLDLTQRKGYRTIEIEYSYLGSANIENYYKEAKRDKNGFRTEFMSPEVKPHKIHSDYLEKTALGYNLKLTDGENTGSAVLSSPPAVSGSNLLISGGYYSRYFYGFDKNTGQNKWGVELADGGASASVSDSGVTLVITQSCTLYALDENTGKPLWTKWLGSSMYSTPTVANGKVYVVYPDNLMAYGTQEKGNYVLACFSLKKGDIIWQQRLDDNVLGSPVVANGKVYISTKAGSVYAIGNDGKNVIHKNVKAISPPTIMGTNVLVSTSKDSKNKDLAMLSTTTLDMVKRLPGTSPVADDNGGAIADMSNDQGRALGYKGKAYYTAGATLYCVDATGKTLWSKPFTGGESAMPIVAGGKIVVATEQGLVHLFSPTDGALVNKYDAGNPIFSQPVIEDGVIYTGTKTGKMNAIKTGDKTLDGWAMWGGNAAHNTVIE